MRQLLVFLLVIALGQPQVAAAMSSTNYTINWDNFNEGGNELGTSTNFQIHDTLGDLATGTSTSASYQLSAGYRVGETALTLSLTLRAQDNATQTAFTAFNNGTKTVTVSAPGTFSVGDYIAVVENVGFAQKVAVGKITSIVGNDLTVDAFDGDNTSISPVPGGGNDFVYRLSGTSVAFGTMTPTTEGASVAMSSVQSSMSGGYSVYVQGDSLLSNSVGQTIATVMDGSVSLGSEEYGASVTGTRAVSPGIDLGVTTTQRVIQTNGGPSSSPADRTAMVYKLAITASTNPGTYHQGVDYTLTANF